ncbi:ATP-binding cassette domain-containing protein [Clostridium tyrobutyricum]|jgi:putative ABC transport system ATP-binding protein|uniref:ABC-type antimicrobial peptide transport system, ATPase component n=2 Tax=Clostridium tyrobutyricum TaxID=1519 RepID=W6N6C6_CLOTY|nr:ABC transporter ATP-binding protein [Clostridium tyrobutyricum]AND85446.1 ABC transporter ATPase [Clostridium tyrobutyricum]ANP69993.1 ABC transporter ATP-binding protein [Clostridium tyrobutyricum]MBR9649332.1 ABC transporter ATP-binding protein [Clostridium tyrobutyricum]MBV4416117.1 ABC transporter ATP-binding protein [Clostridium tyrobutyricum]MBV4418537.1 ABC transporter ATP-binding protein [Clostridium tyrobutyricum]
MIEVKGVSKIYTMGKEQVTALDNVNLTIKDGEFVAIVGPSGSGKSTLMHLVGGLDTPTSGSIVVNGKDISKLKDKDMSKYRNQTIGFVFQSFNLENTQTALENVMMPLIFAGTGNRERKLKANRALEIVGLQDKIKHKPNEMSGGQRQRVSIARALVNEPSIIFADEPTGNLDSKNGELIMNLLSDLNEKGYTIIMVTHNMEEAKKAKRMIKIRDGQVQEVSRDEI